MSPREKASFIAACDCPECVVIHRIWVLRHRMPVVDGLCERHGTGGVAAMTKHEAEFEALVADLIAARVNRN